MTTSVRVHTADLSNVVVEAARRPRVAELFGDDFEFAGDTALIVEDFRNLEAFVIAATVADIRRFARRIVDACDRVENVGRKDVL